MPKGYSYFVGQEVEIEGSHLFGSGYEGSWHRGAIAQMATKRGRKQYDIVLSEDTLNKDQAKGGQQAPAVPHTCIRPANPFQTFGGLELVQPGMVVEHCIPQCPTVWWLALILSCNGVRKLTVKVIYPRTPGEAPAVCNDPKFIRPAFTFHRGSGVWLPVFQHFYRASFQKALERHWPGMADLCPKVMDYSTQHAPTPHRTGACVPLLTHGEDDTESTMECHRCGAQSPDAAAGARADTLAQSQTPAAAAAAVAADGCNSAAAAAEGGKEADAGTDVGARDGGAGAEWQGERLGENGKGTAEGDEQVPGSARSAEGSAGGAATAVTVTAPAASSAAGTVVADVAQVEGLVVNVSCGGGREGGDEATREVTSAKTKAELSPDSTVTAAARDEDAPGRKFNAEVAEASAGGGAAAGAVEAPAGAAVAGVDRSSVPQQNIHQQPVDMKPVARQEVQPTPPTPPLLQLRHGVPADPSHVIPSPGTAQLAVTGGQLPPVDTTVSVPMGALVATIATPVATPVSVPTGALVATVAAPVATPVPAPTRALPATIAADRSISDAGSGDQKPAEATTPRGGATAAEATRTPSPEHSRTPVATALAAPAATLFPVAATPPAPAAVALAPVPAEEVLMAPEPEVAGEVAEGAAAAPPAPAEAVPAPAGVCPEAAADVAAPADTEVTVTATATADSTSQQHAATTLGMDPCSAENLARGDRTDTVQGAADGSVCAPGSGQLTAHPGALERHGSFLQNSTATPPMLPVAGGAAEPHVGALHAPRGDPAADPRGPPPALARPALPPRVNLKRPQPLSQLDFSESALGEMEEFQRQRNQRLMAKRQRCDAAITASAQVAAPLSHKLALGAGRVARAPLAPRGRAASKSCAASGAGGRAGGPRARTPLAHRPSVTGLLSPGLVSAGGDVRMPCTHRPGTASPITAALAFEVDGGRAAAGVPIAISGDGGGGVPPTPAPAAVAALAALDPADAAGGAPPVAAGDAHNGAAAGWRAAWAPGSAVQHVWGGGAAAAPAPALRGWTGVVPGAAAAADAAAAAAEAANTMLTLRGRFTQPASRGQVEAAVRWRMEQDGRRAPLPELIR